MKCDHLKSGALTLITSNEAYYATFVRFNGANCTCNLLSQKSWIIVNLVFNIQFFNKNKIPLWSSYIIILKDSRIKTAYIIYSHVIIQIIYRSGSSVVSMYFSNFSKECLPLLQYNLMRVLPLWISTTFSIYTLFIWKGC